MSRTYHIVCHQCRTHLWIGQGTSDRSYIYRSEKHNEAQNTFFFGHLRHPLEFMETQELPDDYEEIEVDDD